MEEELDVSSTYSNGGLQFSDATEYVKQQLNSMGVKGVSDRELEAYTQDFLQLLKEKEENEHSDNDSDEENNSVIVPPVSAAVYKTVLHNDSVQVQPAAASVCSSTPTPSLNTSFDRHCGIPDKPVLQVTVRNSGDRVIKRKILRNCDPSSYSADNSAISDCSYTRGDSRQCSHRSSAKPPKSFIRPTTELSHNIKGTYIKKCDPVQRYHEYNDCWKIMKPPGEQPRHGLRWHIREQLLLQDNPVVSVPPPPHPVKKPSQYIVPTSKKRQNLRWAIRHQLAQK